MHNSLTIQNFTAFKEAQFDFIEGINVFVGGNASGKTHVLKLLYTIQKLGGDAHEHARGQANVVHEVFQPERLRDLIRIGTLPNAALITNVLNSQMYELSIDAENSVCFDMATRPWVMGAPPVFIPAADMLAHFLGFLSLYDQRHVDFDLTQRDILANAYLPTLRESGRTSVEPLLARLASVLEGKVEVKGDRFYITGASGSIEMHLVAAGWRKLALLYQLIANGSIAPGTVLLWDEPEANLNPGMFPVVAEILARLAAVGTQIHLASHSYALLRELEFAATDQNCGLRIFALDRTDSGVKVAACDRFIDIQPNKILDEYDRLYRLTVQEALNGDKIHQQVV